MRPGARDTRDGAEEAQVDWGAFGAIRIGRGVRPLSGFVMVPRVLAWHLRAIHGRSNAREFSARPCRAFQTWPGVARTLLYDNLRNAVLERAGTAIRFHPRLLELAGHYHFAPRPCTPGRANENQQRRAFRMSQVGFACADCSTVRKRRTPTGSRRIDMSVWCNCPSVQQ